MLELNVCENEINEASIETFWIGLHNNTSMLVFHFDQDEEAHESMTLLSVRAELELNREIKHEIVPN